MWRFIHSLNISAKLFLTSLGFIFLFLCLSAAAYVGLSSQRNGTEALFQGSYRSLGQITQTASGIAEVHAGISHALLNAGGRTEAERMQLLQDQRAAVAAVLGSAEKSLSSGVFTPEDEAFNRGLIGEIKAFSQLVAEAENILHRDAASVERFLASSDEGFLRAAKKLREAADREQARGRHAYEESANRYRSALLIIIALFLVSVCLSVLLNIFVMRRAIVSPIKAIERSAKKVAGGDLSFDAEAANHDEIGRVVELLREAFHSLSGVLGRIKELSERILAVVEEVEKTSEKVLSGAETEAEATNSISSAVEEMNATVAEIADSTEGLASSTEEVSTSIDEMVSSIHSINENIQELNRLVASSSGSMEQLSKAIEGVAANSAELEQASDDTITAISQIAAAVRDVDTHARESASLSEKVTKEAATLGLQSISKTIEGMSEISGTVHAAAEYILSLGSRSKEIEKITHVIKSVNDETNLLALNAAILASRAGEHGKGFAVVAREIKDLSERTENSAKEIVSMIQAVQIDIGKAGEMMDRGVSSVADGILLAKEGEAALQKILESSQKASEMTFSIKKATEEQARSADLVEKASRRVKTMIHHIAEATERQSKEIGLITGVAENMKQLSLQVSKATGEQAKSSGHIAQTTELVSEKSRQISRSLTEHRKGSQSILGSIEDVKNIPVENRKLAARLTKTLWNLQKDAELLGAEMERFTFSETGGHSIRFGVVPLKGPSEMYRKFKPLSEYLAEKIGKKVDLKVAVDMESALKDLGSNVTQICAMGPVNYVEANVKYGIVAVAKALRKGKPFHQAAIIVKDGSSIRSVRDLKGRKFAFGNAGSATGHIMPLAVLKDAGITLHDLAQYQFFGHHEKVVKAVLDGMCDAGGIIEEVARDYFSQGIRILSLSVKIPEFNVCCNQSVDQQIRDRLRDALISLDISRPADARLLTSLGKDCTGFVAASTGDYAEFKEKLLSVTADVTKEEHRLAGGYVSG